MGTLSAERSEQKSVSQKPENPVRKIGRILREIALNGFNKFATTQHVVPNAIVVRDGKLIAIEIERERWESGVRHKMKSYDEYPAHGYDEVLLFWYTPDNIRRKVWTLKDGEWSLTWTITLS